MNLSRRKLLKATGATTSSLLLAGCQNQSQNPNTNPTTQNTDNSNLTDPVPGYVVPQFRGVTGNSITFKFFRVQLPRKGKFRLIREKVTPDAATKHKHNKFTLPENAGKIVTETTVEPKNSEFKLTIENIKPLYNTPIQYRLEYVDSTLPDSPTRKLDFRTQLIFFPKWNKQTALKYPLDKRDLPIRKTTDDDGTTHIKRVLSTYRSRFNYSDKAGRGDDGRGLGLNELPASISYSISKDAYEEVVGIEQDYAQKTVTDDENVAYLANHDWSSYDCINEVATQLKEIANYWNLNTPVEELRLLADFHQLLPYKYDKPHGSKNMPENYAICRSPVRTLADVGADCEDFSLLFDALASHPKFDYDTTIFHVESNDDINFHIAPGVNTNELNVSIEKERQNSRKPVKTHTSDHNGNEYLYVESVGLRHLGLNLYNTEMDYSIFKLADP